MKRWKVEIRQGYHSGREGAVLGGPVEFFFKRQAIRYAEAMQTDIVFNGKPIYTVHVARITEAL